MRPARRLGDRPRRSIGLIEPIEPAIGVGLQNSAIVDEMAFGMRAAAIAREVIDRRRRVGAAEWPIVADTGPQAGLDSLALRQQRNRRVVAMDARAGKDMGADQVDQRLEHGGASTHVIGEGRERQFDALSGILVTLPVERLVQGELGIEDHRQQARSRPAAHDHMERGGRLGDLLAGPAGELLPQSSPSLDSRVEPQQAQVVGPGMTIRSRGR